MRENRTSGSVQGAPGNRRSYCERRLTMLQNRCSSSPEYTHCFLVMGNLLPSFISFHIKYVSIAVQLSGLILYTIRCGV